MANVEVVPAMTDGVNEFDDEFLAVSKPASHAKSSLSSMTPQPQPVRRVSTQTKIRRSIVAKLEALAPDEVGTAKDDAIGRPPLRGKSGLTVNEEQRLVARSINENWASKERFPESQTVEAIKKKPKKDRTPSDVAMITALAGCEPKVKNVRAQQIAVKNVIKMIEVNQRDQIHEVPPAPIGVGVAVNVNNTGDGSATASVGASRPRVVLYLPENGR